LGFIRLSRPINVTIVFISVFLGALLAKGKVDPLGDVLLAATSLSLMLAAGNAINDFCDVETDRINKPSRPIPSGQIKRQSAIVFSLLLFSTGIILSLFINWTAFPVACIITLLLILYTLNLRRLLLIGNVVVGLLTGSAFIWGGIAVKSIAGSIIPAVFAFLFTVSREIVKDIQDVKGDKAVGLPSLPVKLGRRKAMYISFIFLALVIIISPLPYLLDIYSIYYLICVVIGVDFVLIYCMSVLLREVTEQSAAKVADLMKFDIFVGLGAIYLGSLG
jgi:geranylgeranylglycerol-phosphate geranylgeranyltransferase